MVKRTPTIHFFYCANSMTEAELQDLQTQLGADGLQSLSLPCSGKATIPYLLKAFETGADAVVLCACPESQCRHLEGNLRAARRAKAVEGLLEEIGLGEDHVVVVTKEQGQSEKLIGAIRHLQTELGKVCSVGVEPARAVLTGRRADQRRENAA